eukprot:5024578-Pleurochrysis_carterae.AAC.1
MLCACSRARASPRAWCAPGLLTRARARAWPWPRVHASHVCLRVCRACSPCVAVPTGARAAWLACVLSRVRARAQMRACSRRPLTRASAHSPVRARVCAACAFFPLSPSKARRL